MPKKATPESASDQILSFLKQHKDEHVNFKEEVFYRVSTGSLILDIETGGGLTPGLHRFCGVNEGGKTSEAFEVMRNFLSEVEDSRGFYVKAEGRLSPEMKDRSGINFVTDPKEWEDGSCFVLESNIYETVFKAMKMLVSENGENKRYCFIVDSVDGLIPKGDLEKDFGEAHKVAGGALLASKIMQRISLDMVKSGHMMILVSQVRSDIQLDPYSKKTVKVASASGGHALLHYANFILEFQQKYKGDLIFENPSDNKIDYKTNRPLGRWAKVAIMKSSNESTDLVIPYPIKYGRTNGTSIWKEYEIMDMMQRNGLLGKAGAWITVDKNTIEELKEADIECPEKFQGRKAFFDFINGNDKFVNYWYERFKNAFV
jgi:RecA/RadA recombinase